MNLIIIAVVGILTLVVAVFLLGNRGLVGKTSFVPDLNEAISQIDATVKTVLSTNGLRGFDPSKVTSDNSSEEIRNNILSKNLTSEEAIRKLLQEELNKIQISTDTGGAGTQVKDIKGVLLAQTPTSSLRVIEAFAPSGSGKFLTVRGTPLAENAIARTQETFSGVLTTTAGGTRTIRGSKALFDRLQANLQK